MDSNTDYERFGGIFLSDFQVYGFFDVPEHSPQQNLWIMHVDSKKFMEHMKFVDHDENSDPFELSANYKIKDEGEVYWLFLKGPRVPVSLPVIKCDGNKFFFEEPISNAHFLSLLKWGATDFPIAVEADLEHLELIESTVGTNISRSVDLSSSRFVGPETVPTIPAEDYLQSVRGPLNAFKEHKTPAEVYETVKVDSRSDPDLARQIQKFITDYARLIDLQLEVMLWKHSIYCQSPSLAQPDRVDRDFRETRRLLNQRTAINPWFEQAPDLKNLPTWIAADKVSEEAGHEFLQGHVPTPGRLQVKNSTQSAFSEAGTDHVKRREPSARPRQTSHLRLVSMNPEGSA